MLHERFREVFVTQTITLRSSYFFVFVILTSRKDSLTREDGPKSNVLLLKYFKNVTEYFFL